MMRAIYFILMIVPSTLASLSSSVHADTNQPVHPTFVLTQPASTQPASTQSPLPPASQSTPSPATLITTLKLNQPDQTVFLTWANDPTTTMIVQWLVTTGPMIPTVRIRKNKADPWRTIMGYQQQFYTAKFNRCRVPIDKLKPDQTYQFQINETGPILTFRTAPATLQHPVTFVSGGDVNLTQTMCDINRRIAEHDPLFALIGGDIAYANGVNTARWALFLANWRHTMIRSDGSLIPLLATLGNHEVQGGFNQTRDKAPLFYLLFDDLFSEHGYASLKVGNYLQLIFMDSGHTEPIEGQQTRWLKKTLSHKTTQYRMAFYHFPAYPSVRLFDNPTSLRIRRNWVPLFEQFAIHACFEHHDHAYKRTRLRHDKPVTRGGVLYLGDGAWGIDNLRTPGIRGQSSYLQKIAKVNHFILTRLTPTTQSHTTLGRHGEVLDQVFVPYPVTSSVTFSK